MIKITFSQICRRKSTIKFFYCKEKRGCTLINAKFPDLYLFFVKIRKYFKPFTIFTVILIRGLSHKDTKNTKNHLCPSCLCESNHCEIPRIIAVESIFLIKPCNTLPGPISVKSLAPSAIIFCTDCFHLTGAVS